MGSAAQGSHFDAAAASALFTVLSTTDGSLVGDEIYILVGAAIYTLAIVDVVSGSLTKKAWSPCA